MLDSYHKLHEFDINFGMRGRCKLQRGVQMKKKKINHLIYMDDLKEGEKKPNTGSEILVNMDEVDLV